MDDYMSAAEVRRHWINRLEIALLDVREEGPYSESHPFFAVSVPVSEIEVKLPSLVPRYGAPIVVYDNGEGYAERAMPRIIALGYTDVYILEGGLSAYARVGELFRDVNVPSKAFGELVEAIRHTPSLPAREVKELLDQDPNVVVVDARRYDEYNTMSIPGGQSCPGGELAYRVRDIAPSPETTVVVNCAGRTRSIIGTQSLIDSGLPNRVVALRNGYIGWTLEGLEFETGKTQRVPKPSEQSSRSSAARVQAWSDHVGVPVIDARQISQFIEEAHERCLFLFDVRDPDEYAYMNHPSFQSAPGGQLVQAIDEWVAVRGARIVLMDDDGVRARMAGSWLYQMGWDVFVVGEPTSVPIYRNTKGVQQWPEPKESAITIWQLRSTLPDVVVVDLARSPIYRKGHIPGAYHSSGPELHRMIERLPGNGDIVLTSSDGRIAAANIIEAQQATSRKIMYLSGGTDAWKAAVFGLDYTERWLTDPIDVYKRPYEGTDSARANMQAYIDWELQLIAQLANDGISGFRVTRTPEKR